MRPRFAIAFGRGAHRHALLEKASGGSLSVRANLPDLLLLAGEETPARIGGRAALVGELFGDGQDHHVASPDSDELLFEPAILAQRSWGNFIACGIADDGRPGVYRDPSGSVPVYQHQAESGEIFISDAELAKSLGLLDAASIDLRFVVHWLQYPFLRTARTGIEDIREVLPGICRTRTNGAWSDQPIWHPGRFTRRAETIIDADEAKEQLRKLALAAVPRQIQGSVLLQLSGGLDSSILAACLHSAGVPFTGVNFATLSADGNELRYARAVADATAAELIELAEQESQALPLPAFPTFRPATNPLLAPIETAVDCCAEQIGASLLVNGGGGDNLFCSVTSAAPVLDALYRAGPRAAIRTIDDIAARAGCTWWDVLKSAARRGIKGRRRWKEDRTLLNRDALLPAFEPHPWLDLPRGTPPGKREHVEALVHIHHFLDRTTNPGREALHPLMAQPLLELCMRIPSWLWLRGGRDRAVARDAFTGLLPRLVLERRTKGSLQSLFDRSFRRLSGEMRERLLGGELHRLGIIDARAIERAFPIADQDELVQMRLTEMTALELWLQSWRR